MAAAEEGTFQNLLSQLLQSHVDKYRVNFYWGINCIAAHELCSILFKIEKDHYGLVI